MEPGFHSSFVWVRHPRRSVRACRHREAWIFKLELVGVPVSYVDCAKAFYVDQAGFVLDHDHTVSDDIRFVQMTPPGSSRDIAIGKGLTQLSPGALDNLQVVVSDGHEARAELAGRGVDVSEVDVQPWGSFVSFSGSRRQSLAVQQVPDYAAAEVARG